MHEKIFIESGQEYFQIHCISYFISRDIPGLMAINSTSNKKRLCKCHLTSDGEVLWEILVPGHILVVQTRQSKIIKQISTTYLLKNLETFSEWHSRIWYRVEAPMAKIAPAKYIVNVIFSPILASWPATYHRLNNIKAAQPTTQIITSIQIWVQCSRIHRFFLAIVQE